MSLNLNGLSPDQTAVALDIVADMRRKSVGPYYFLVPLSRKRDPVRDVQKIVKAAKAFNINLDCEMIADHIVDKRNYRRVKFTSKERLRMPVTAVFIFPRDKDQVVF